MMAVPKYFPVEIGDQGSHVEGYGRAMARSGLPGLTLAVFSALPKKTRSTWGWWHKRAANKIKKKEGWEQNGQWDKKLYHRLMDDGDFDAKATALVNFYIPIHPKIPDLGPVWAGGKNILAQDLTHSTSGIPFYPAFDDAFIQGRAIIAPEDMTVDKKLSSSNPGKAFYATGKSQIRYWFGHLDRSYPLGTKFKKGQVVGKVAPNSVGGGPHVHVGVNVELLWGAGKQLQHHTNYTHGAPLVGVQLALHK